MNKTPLLFIVLFGFSSITLAKRSSGLSFDSSRGTGNYNTFGVSGRIGLGETWQIKGRTQSAKSEQNRSRYGALGANAQINDDWNIGALVQGSREPNDLKSRGIAPSADFLLSSLWKGKHNTNLHAGYELNRYRQSAGANRAPIGDFTQRALHLEIAQDCGYDVEVTAATSSYRYGANGGVINGVVNRRVAELPLDQGMVVGFPKSAGALGLSWMPIGGLTLDFDIGRSKVVDSSERTKFIGGGVGLDFGGPQFGFHYMRSKTGSLMPQKYYSFNFGYGL